MPSNNLDTVVEGLESSATACHALRLSLIPMRVQRRGDCTFDKRPVVRWKPYQQRRMPLDELLGHLRRPGVNAIAALNGPVSNHWAVRDWDGPAGRAHCEQWEAEHPKLAARCPKVRTASGGYHTWFCVPEDFTLDTGGGYSPQGDGEIRISGCLNVLPFSFGGRWTWIRSPWVCEPPVIDPYCQGLATRCRAQETELGWVTEGGVAVPEGNQQEEVAFRRELGTGSDVPLEEELEPWLRLPDWPRIEAAIQNAIPPRYGTRNERLFRLVRASCAIPALREKPTHALRPIVRLWHRESLGTIRTKHFAVSWREFTAARKLVRHPGEGVLREAMLAVEHGSRAELPCLRDEAEVVIASVCCELQRLNGSAPFFLSSDKAAALAGVGRDRAFRVLNKLVRRGILQVMSRGKSGAKGKGIAREYRWLG